MTVNTIKIGTRGSKLAIYQAKQVEEMIGTIFPEIRTEIVIVKTKGDKITDLALSKIGDKGLFTKELENKLIDKNIDMAVHSLKDLPTELPETFRIGAVLERADFRDALVSRNHKKLSKMNAGDRIGTSSLRRQANLLYINKDFQIVNIRGNINTRIKKMEDGHCDAIVMAAAGLIRLGMDSYITEILDPETFVPAVSQGIIAVESRKDDHYINNICEKLDHQRTRLACRIERAFLKTLEGGCQIPAGCYTSFGISSVSITGFIASPDGKPYIKEQLNGPLEEPEELGSQLARKLLDLGGDKISKEIRGL